MCAHDRCVCKLRATLGLRLFMYFSFSSDTYEGCPSPTLDPARQAGGRPPFPVDVTVITATRERTVTALRTLQVRGPGATRAGTGGVPGTQAVRPGGLQVDRSLMLRVHIRVTAE